MKHISLLSIAAVITTVSLSLGFAAGQHSGVFYSVVSCSFLLLIALNDYGRSSRYRLSHSPARHTTSTEPSTQRLRLAA